jgi:hypothetical protein
MKKRNSKKELYKKFLPEFLLPGLSNKDNEKAKEIPLKRKTFTLASL